MQETVISKNSANSLQSSLKRLTIPRNPNESVAKIPPQETSNSHTLTDQNGQPMSATRLTPTLSPSHPSPEGARGRILTYHDLARCFHLPINTAARELGVCVTALKKQCRKHGVQRWPHRKLKSLDKLKEKLEREEATAADKDYYKHEIHSIVQKKDHIFRAAPARQKSSPSATITATTNPNISSTIPESTHLTQNPHYSPSLAHPDAHPHFPYPVSHDQFAAHTQHPPLMLAPGVSFSHPSVPGQPPHAQPPSAMMPGQFGPIPISSGKFSFCGVIGCDCAFNSGVSSQNYHMPISFRPPAHPQALQSTAQPSTNPSASAGFSSPTLTHPFYHVPPPSYPYGASIPYPGSQHAPPMFHNMVQLNVVDQQPYGHSPPAAATPGANGPPYPPGTQVAPPGNAHQYSSGADAVHRVVPGANVPRSTAPQSSTGYDAYSTSGSPAVNGGLGARNAGAVTGTGNSPIGPKNIPPSPATEAPGCVDGIPAANISPQLAAHYWTGGMGQPAGGGNTFTMYNQSTHFHHHHAIGERPALSSTGAPSRGHKTSCPDAGPTVSSSATINSAKRIGHVSETGEPGSMEKNKFRGVTDAVRTVGLETNEQPSSNCLNVPEHTEDDRKTETAMASNGINGKMGQESDDSGDESDELGDESKNVNESSAAPSADADAEKIFNDDYGSLARPVKDANRHHSDSKRGKVQAIKNATSVKKRKRAEEHSDRGKTLRPVEVQNGIHSEAMVGNLNGFKEVNYIGVLENGEGALRRSKISNGQHGDKGHQHGAVEPDEEHVKCDGFQDSSGNSGAIATIKREYTKSNGLRDETPSSDDGSMSDEDDVKNKVYSNDADVDGEGRKDEAEKSNYTLKVRDSINDASKRRKCEVVDPASPGGGTKPSTNHEDGSRQKAGKRESGPVASGSGSEGTVNACMRSRARRYEHVMMNCLGVGCAQWCTDKLLRVTLAVGTRVLLGLVGVGSVGSSAVDCVCESTLAESSNEMRKRYNAALSGQKTEWIITTEKRNVLIVLAPFRKRSGAEIAGVSGIVLEVSSQIQCS